MPWAEAKCVREVVQVILIGDAVLRGEDGEPVLLGERGAELVLEVACFTAASKLQICIGSGKSWCT